MSGEQKTFDDSTPIGPKGLLKHKPLTAFDVVKDAIQEAKKAGRDFKQKTTIDEQVRIAALKAALAELIPIAERHHKYFSSWLGWLDENGRDDETGEKPDWVDRLPIYKAAIDRAKKLLHK